jgi:hypothetical protein
MSDNITFTRDLIKGKTAEIIFQRMFLESGEFKVLPLGYEYTLPELALHEHKNPLIKKVTAHLRDIPDFVLISNKNSDVFIVEVKYRHAFDQDKVKIMAEEIHARWDYAQLFLATPEGFYFDSANKVKAQGEMNPLPKNWVSIELQHEYLIVLNESTIH